MATPTKYIRVNGQVYQLVEAAEMPPSHKKLYQDLINRYFAMLEDVDFEAEKFLVQNALLRTRDAALELEESLQENFRPTDWSIRQSFVDAAQALLEYYELLGKAAKALDRRPQLAGYADQKGMNIPEDYLE